MSTVQDKKTVLVVTGDEQIKRNIQKLELDFPVESIILKGSYETLQALRKKHANLVILDFNIPLISAHELVTLVHGSYPDIPIIIIADSLTSNQKKGIIEAGAFDYICRPFDFEELKIKIGDLLFSEAYHYHLTTLRKKIKKTFGLENIIGDCEAMWKVFNAIKNISISDVTVFYKR